MFLLACFLMFSLVDFVNHQGRPFETVANMSLCVCAFLNLMFLHQLGSLVGPYAYPFINYAETHNFLHAWGKGGVWCLIFTSIVWVIATSLTCMSSVVRTEEYLTVPMISFRDGCLLASVHCLWQILTFLELAVDRYCLEFFEHRDCQEGVSVWNGLQALLRRVAEAVENCFLTMQSAVIIAVLCCAGRLVTMTINLITDSADVDAIGMMLLSFTPVIVTAFATLVLCTKAASVTAKCSRVPALINSMTSKEGKHIDHEHQYLVTYIAHSDAGFYVKGSRFTTALLVKFWYLIVAIVCSMVSTALTMAKRS